jgi:hypothetical protein
MAELAKGPLPGITTLEQDAERALFDGALDGLVCLFFRNERPLGGLSGVLDWRFHGRVSQTLRIGAIQGETGECVYMPFERHGRTFHVLLAGAGVSESPGVRARPPLETLEKIKKNLMSLKIAKFGISRKDFGGVPDSFLSQHLKGVGLWVAP